MQEDTNSGASQAPTDSPAAQASEPHAQDAAPTDAPAPAAGELNPGNPDKPDAGPPYAEQPPAPPVEAKRSPFGFDASPKINCEICGKLWTAADPYLPEKCGRGPDCPIDDVPPRLNAADGRQTLEEIEAEAFAKAEAAEKAEAERLQAIDDARAAETARLRALHPLPSDANDHFGLVQVTVVGDGESMSVQIAGTEVPRGIAVMVPPYVRDALADENLLA